MTDTDVQPSQPQTTPAVATSAENMATYPFAQSVLEHSGEDASGGFFNRLFNHPVFPWAVLAGLCFILFFYQLGSYPLFDIDEPRYAEAAREMIETGDWITPYFNYEVRFDKPVFFYWLVALAYNVFGVTEFAARFWSASFASITVFALYGFARHWSTPRMAFASALMLASSIQFAGLARMSITDMTLSGLMGLTTLSLFCCVHGSRKWWLVAGLFSGLACLTKGPVGIVLPGGIMLMYALMSGQAKKTFLNAWFVMGLVVWAAVSVPWYVLAYRENGEPFLDALFFHNFTRFSDTVSGHHHPWWFFLVVMVVGFMPWSTFLPAVLPWLYQGMERGLDRNAWGFPGLNNPSPARLAASLSDSTMAPQPYDALWQSGTALHTASANLPARRFFAPESRLALGYLALFGLLWTVITLLFFSASHTKLLTYVLPMFPGMALVFGCFWEVVSQEAAALSGIISPKKGLQDEDFDMPVMPKALEANTASASLPSSLVSVASGAPQGSLQAKWYPWLSRLSGLLFALVLVVSTIAMVSIGNLLPREARHMSTDPYLVLPVVLVMVVGLGITYLCLRNRQVMAALTAQALTIAAVVFVGMNGLVPAINQVTQGAMLTFLSIVGNEPLATYEIQRPSLTYYAQKRVHHIASDDQEKLEALLEAYGRLFIITKNSFVKRFEDYEIINPTIRWQVVKEQPVYSLLRLEKPVESAD